MTYDQSLEEPCEVDFDQDAVDEAQENKRDEQELERRFNTEKPCQD